jgi:hypothetical protein
VKTGHWFWLHGYAVIANASAGLSAIDLPQACNNSGKMTGSVKG